MIRSDRDEGDYISYLSRNVWLQATSLSSSLSDIFTLEQPHKVTGLSSCIIPIYSMIQSIEQGSPLCVGVCVCVLSDRLLVLFTASRSLEGDCWSERLRLSVCFEILSHIKPLAAAFSSKKYIHPATSIIPPPVNLKFTFRLAYSIHWALKPGTH